MVLATCCERTYLCPTSGETECPLHGGFDVCCNSSNCPGRAIGRVEAALRLIAPEHITPMGARIVRKALGTVE